MIINDIKKVTNEALLVSSCHGLPNMIRTKSKCLLIMWLICFLICSAFFSYLAILSIAKFFKYEVLTNIEVIYESPAHFPIITICNLNGVKHSYLLNETIIFLFILVNISICYCQIHKYFYSNEKNFYF